MKDRRIIDDRRKQMRPLLSRYTFFGGRRKTIRRKEDKKKHVLVDHYGLQLFITLLSLFILSVLDAYLTLELVKANIATEVNPILALYLEHSSVTFLLEKFLFTLVAVFIFCVGNHFSITRISLALVIIIYLGVVSYEVNIMHNFFPRF
jgi:hypothetical protein